MLVEKQKSPFISSLLIDFLFELMNILIAQGKNNPNAAGSDRC